MMRLARRGRAADRALVAGSWLASGVLAGLFVLVLARLVGGGAASLSWSFVVESPLDAGRAGGIGPILVSTVMILGVCLAAAVPLGLGTAVLLSEFTPRGSRRARAVRRSLDVLAAVPSIVFGLFGNAFFSVVLGLGFSIVSGGLTLACMVLPILIRSAEVGLRSAPDEWRRAAAALGISRARTAWSILLPTAMPGIAAGLVLGVARALAETAALLFTSGYVERMPGSLLDSGRALTVHIYDLSMNVPGGDAHASASALVLIVLLMTINGAIFSLPTRGPSVGEGP